jgi:hypothetical protein
MGNPSTAYITAYQNTIYLLAQQLDTRLRGAVVVDSNWTGIAKFYAQYGSDTAQELLGRYADTPLQLPDFRSRMVTPRYFVSATLEDPKDALQMVIDPKSTMYSAKMAAFNRTTDDLIIAAMGGTAYTGQAGATPTAFLAANQIAYNLTAATGLSKAKVLRASRLLNAGEVEKTERYLAHSAAQLEDLLNTTEVASSDYNVVKALVQGELNTWIGFSFIHTERLLTNGSSQRLCYAWQKWALQLAIQKDIEGRLDERIDKNMAWQVYMRMCMGATRLEEARIVEIPCVE